MAKSIGWTVTGIVAALAPVLAVALVAQFRILAPSDPPPSAVYEDQAIPVADGSPPASPPPPEAGSPPSALKLPTIEELTPRHGSAGTPRSDGAAVMPEKLSDPYVATVDANAAAAETNVPPTPTKNASTLRRREGASVRDVEGSISKQSVQTVFVPSDGSPPMNLLENQMLERVEAMLESAGPNAGRIRWRLSGKVTEYRGANYLLLSTASQIDTAVQP